MKRILFILAFLAPALMFGQKIRDLTTSTSAASSDLIIMAENGEDTLKHITKANFLSDYVAVSDTSSMLTVYMLKTDTAAMLSPYLLESDTTAMLLPYILETEVDGVYLALSDTSSMMSNYILASEVAAVYEPLLTNSAGLASALSDETGTGVAVFGTSPTFTTQITIGSEAITETVAGYLNNVTSNVQTQLDAKADIANESHTGSTSIADLTATILSVGTTANVVSLDSIIKDASNNLWFFDGSDTLSIGFTASGTESLDDYAVMLADSSTIGEGYYATSYDVSLKANLASPDFTGNLNIAPRSSPVTTDEGDLYYDTEDDSLYLRVNSAWVALNREAGGGGSGDVTKYGTPVNNQLAVWRSDGVVEGEPNITYDSTTYILQVAETLRVGSGTYMELDASSLTIGSADIGETELEILDGATISTTELNYLETARDTIQKQLDDTVSIETLTPLLTDDLYPVKQWKSGWGRAVDTTKFETTIDLGHGEYKVKEDSLEITEIEYYISSGDTLDFYLVFGTTLGTATDTIDYINAEDGVMTSITSGFDTSTVDEGNYIWIDVSGVTAGRRPNLLLLDLYGYIKRD